MKYLYLFGALLCAILSLTGSLIFIMACYTLLILAKLEILEDKIDKLNKE